MEADVGDQDRDPAEDLGDGDEVLEPSEDAGGTGGCGHVGEEGDGGCEEDAVIWYASVIDEKMICQLHLQHDE